MGKSKIDYLQHVWSPISGCSGRGCQAHCYAREIVKRFPAIHETEPLEYPGLGIPFNQVVFHPDRLDEPLRRKRPTVYGVGFFGDMFDEQVKNEWLGQVYDLFLKCQQHTFIILTKQAHRMAEWCVSRYPEGYHRANVWHGVTVCTQAEADERIPELLKVPGKKWVSIEPMLGPVDLWDKGFGPLNLKDGISLVVVGCESGPKRRTPLYQWFADVVQQCKSAGVPCYVKQYPFRGKVSINPAEWPPELRVRDLPWRHP